MLTADTKRRIDACRDVLVGKLPLPTDQVELITLSLIYKFMDDLDKESIELGGKRSFFTGELSKYRWRNLLPQTVSADERVALFSEGIEALGHAKKAAHLPGLFRDIFRNSFLKFRDGRILTMFLSEVNGFTYSHSEELGNAFEYLLQGMGIQGENGQFRTPRHIIDFIVACLDPQPDDKILDPACGTGGFLVSAYKHILGEHTSRGSTVPGDELTHGQRQKVYANLAGYDTTDLMVKLSKVNLFLHGFPDPAIHIYDTLSNDSRWNEKADLILANPPFMTPKGGVVPHTKFRIAAKKTEVLFTDYIAEHLLPDGRAGIIVPNGIVATTQNAYVKLRRFLVEDSLVAVISLPAGVFRPYSGVKTSILLLDKKLARQTQQVLFLKVNADGFDLGDQRKEIEANDLPEAKRVVNALFKRALDEKFHTPLAWKLIEKPNLIEHRACSLQVETFFGEKAVNLTAEMALLGDVATLSNGGTPSKANASYWHGDIPWVSPKDMKSLFLSDTEDHVSLEAIETSATKLLPAETILCVVRSGILQHTLPVAMTTRPMCTNQDILAIAVDRTKLIPKFLLYVLKGRSTEILRDGIKTGVTVQSFHNGFFKTFEIPLPPMEEQRRIVAEIDDYQKVLDGARQILSAGEMRILVEASWPTITFEELCERMQYGLSLPLNEDKRGVKTFRMAELVRGRAFDNGAMKWADIDTKDTRKYRLAKGDILFNRTNSYEHVGRTGIFSLDGEYAFASYLIRLSVKRELAEPEYVNAWMNTREFQTGVKSLASRAVGQSNISASALASYTIPLPPLAEQRRIVAELDAENSQMEAVRAMVPVFERKVQRVLDRVWGDGGPEN